MYKSLHIRALTTSLQWRKLFEAIQTDNLLALDTILTTHGWPTDTSCSDYEVLIFATKLGRKKIVHHLLDQNCRVSYDTANNTPLHYAVRYDGWTDVIERLLEKGCRVSDANDSGKTPVHVAFKVNAMGKDIDYLLQHYLRTSNANIISKDGLSTLHIACTRSNAQIVEKLIEADGSLINQAIVESMLTPLHYAVNNRRHRVVKVLLNHGADIYKCDVEGSTPLHWALWTRDVKMIDLILSYDKRKENFVNKFGLSHFMVSCAGSNVDAVTEYIEKTCTGKATSPQDLMSTQINGLGSYSEFTPLHFAVEFGSSNAIVKMLLQYGADCCATTCHQLTPHYLAVMKGHEAISQIMQKHCYDRAKNGKN